jgi:hypothetical protein
MSEGGFRRNDYGANGLQAAVHFGPLQVLFVAKADRQQLAQVAL